MLVAAQEGDQRAHEIQRVRGAAADVDGLLPSRRAFVDAHRAGGVGLGRLHAAERGAGPVGDHGLGLGEDAAADVEHGMPGDVAVFAFIRRGDGPFHDADEALGSGNGLLQSRFGGFAAAAMMVSW